MLKINNRLIEINHFPDQTLLLKVAPIENSIFQWQYESSEEFVVIQMLVLHFRSHGIKHISLWMPYVPNARQDRVKQESDIFTLKYFSYLINQLCFDRVYVLDVHSKVSLEMINNVENISAEKYICRSINEIKLDKNKDMLFFPDKGAMDRYSNMVDFPCLYGEKVRDFQTGEIKQLDIVGMVSSPSFRVCIIDDICSYGGTFFHSAKKLKQLGAKEIYLYVTHMENSILKGDLIKSNLLEKIYTTDSIFKETHPLINVFKLNI